MVLLHGFSTRAFAQSRGALGSWFSNLFGAKIGFLTPLLYQILFTVSAQCDSGHTARFNPARARTPATSAIVMISIVTLINITQVCEFNNQHNTIKHGGGGAFAPRRLRTTVLSRSGCDACVVQYYSDYIQDVHDGNKLIPVTQNVLNAHR